MNIDMILSQLGGNATVGNLAGKFGLSPEMVQTAIQALAKAQPKPGDTAQEAAASTGLSIDTLQGMIGQLGGEGGLAALTALLSQQGGLGGIMSALDRDGDGNPLNDIADLASGFFGKK